MKAKVETRLEPLGIKSAGLKLKKEKERTLSGENLTVYQWDPLTGEIDYTNYTIEEGTSVNFVIAFGELIDNVFYTDDFEVDGVEYEWATYKTAKIASPDTLASESVETYARKPIDTKKIFDVAGWIAPETTLDVYEVDWNYGTRVIGIMGDDLEDSFDEAYATALYEDILTVVVSPVVIKAFTLSKA